MALFDLAQGVLGLVVLGFDLVLGRLVLRRQQVGIHVDDIDRTGLFGTEIGLVGGEVGLEIGVRGGGDVAHGGLVEGEVFDGAGRRPVGIDETDGRLRQRGAVEQPNRDLFALQGLGLLVLELRFGEAVLLQGLVEDGAVEGAEDALEIGVVDNAFPELGVGGTEPVALGEDDARGIGGQLLQDRAGDAHGLGLLRGRLLAGLLRDLAEPRIIGAAEIIGRNTDVADGGHRIAAQIENDVGNTESGKPDQQQTAQDLARQGRGEPAHQFKHSGVPGSEVAVERGYGKLPFGARARNPAKWLKLLHP